LGRRIKRSLTRYVRACPSIARDFGDAFILGNITYKIMIQAKGKRVAYDESFLMLFPVEISKKCIFRTNSTSIEKLDALESSSYI